MPERMSEAILARAVMERVLLSVIDLRWFPWMCRA